MAVRGDDAVAEAEEEEVDEGVPAPGVAAVAAAEVAVDPGTEEDNDVSGVDDCDAAGENQAGYWAAVVERRRDSWGPRWGCCSYGRRRRWDRLRPTPLRKRRRRRKSRSA